MTGEMESKHTLKYKGMKKVKAVHLSWSIRYILTPCRIYRLGTCTLGHCFWWLGDWKVREQPPSSLFLRGWSCCSCPHCSYHSRQTSRTSLFLSHREEWSVFKAEEINNYDIVLMYTTQRTLVQTAINEVSKWKSKCLCQNAALHFHEA